MKPLRVDTKKSEVRLNHGVVLVEPLTQAEKDDAINFLMESKKE